MRWKLVFAFLSFAAGLALAGYSEYCFTRSGPSPVSIPILGSPFHMTRKFFACGSARYRNGVAFDEPEKLVFATPDCVADPDDFRNECSGRAASLNASWTMSQESRVIQHGSAADTVWRVHGQPFLALGDFPAAAWQWYQLDVDVISYEARLAQAKPRLTVEIWTEKPIVYQHRFLAAKLAARITYGLCLFIGSLLIFFASLHDGN